jgi:hypothetical protein
VQIPNRQFSMKHHVQTVVWRGGHLEFVKTPYDPTLNQCPEVVPSP